MERRARPPLDLSQHFNMPVQSSLGELTLIMSGGEVLQQSFKSDVIGSVYKRMVDDGLMTEERFEEFMKSRRPIIDMESNEPLFEFDSIAPELRSERKSIDNLIAIYPSPVPPDAQLTFHHLKPRQKNSQ